MNSLDLAFDAEQEVKCGFVRGFLLKSSLGCGKTTAKSHKDESKQWAAKCLNSHEETIDICSSSTYCIFWQMICVRVWIPSFCSRSPLCLIQNYRQTALFDKSSYNCNLQGSVLGLCITCVCIETAGWFIKEGQLNTDCCCFPNRQGLSFFIISIIIIIECKKKEFIDLPMKLILVLWGIFCPVTKDINWRKSFKENVKSWSTYSISRLNFHLCIMYYS